MSKKSKKRKNKKKTKAEDNAEDKGTKETQQHSIIKPQKGRNDLNLGEEKDKQRQVEERGRSGRLGSSLQDYFGRSRSQSSKRGLPKSPGKQDRPEKSNKLS